MWKKCEDDLASKKIEKLRFYSRRWHCKPEPFTHHYY
jgi:hypothetical protein